MENQVVLLIGLAFVAALGFILKQANPGTPVKAIKEKPARREKQLPKTKKPSQKKSQKKGEQIKEWVGVDTAAKDAQDMLEFLKGRDPKEISKALKAQTPKPKVTAQPVAPVVQNNKKGKNQKQQAQNEVANEVNEEGFSVIQKKAPKEKKNKKNKQVKDEEKEETRSPRQKSFFRADEEALQQQRKERQEARAKGGENKEKRERAPREDRPKRERKEKQEGDESNTESDSGTPKPKRERRERKEGEEERPPRVITAPNVPKYEAPDLDDVLNMMTSSYKASPAAVKQQRESSVFSKIPRDIMADRILIYLSAKDLLTLARVNQFFKSAVRTDRIWKNLYLKEFGSENTAGIKSWMREYKKRKTGKGARAVDETKKVNNKEEKKNPKQ